MPFNYSYRRAQVPSRSLVAALLIASGLLAGCSSPSYRCPLDPDKTPDSPSACTSMQEALAGAKASAGGKNSVVVDDGGRLLKSVSSLFGQKQLQENSVISRMAISQSSGDAFKTSPTFEQPKVFQFWTPAQVDAQGVFHEGRQSWMATTGRWKAPGTTGSGYRPSLSAHTEPVGDPALSASSANSGYVLRPSMPTDSFNPKFYREASEGRALSNLSVPGTQSGLAASGSPTATVPTPAAAAAKKEQKSSALTSFSSALVNSTQKTSPGITAPSVGLAD